MLRILADFVLTVPCSMQNKNNYVLKSVKGRGVRLPSDESLISNVIVHTDLKITFTV